MTTMTTDEIQAGDRVTHRVTGKQGDVIQKLDVEWGEYWMAQYGEAKPAPPLVLVGWIGDPKPTAEFITDLRKP